MPDTTALLPELERIVREAGRIALSLQPGIDRTIKPDGSIVTSADCRVEEFLREQLAGLSLKTGIYGEEMGSSPEQEDGLWCLDPIDGTSNYAFGSPLWGVSVGLVSGIEIPVGAIYLPGLDEMYLAESGHGATLNGVTIPPITPGLVRREELISYPDRILKQYPFEKIPGKMRHTGAFVIDAVFTATQRYRGLLGVREKLYDVAASLCIAGEVNADVRYADGSPIDLRPLKVHDARFEKGWIIFPRESGLVLG
jgi:myo-inositol-1(or 4)-monophosphatase